MNHKFFKYYFWILGLGFLLACESRQNADEVTQTIDAELEALLVQASNNVGKSHFQFPESDQLSLIPQDPLNPLTPAKVALGKLLFHETALGVVPRKGISTEFYSCATCHHAKAGFQAGVAQGIGEGGSGFGTNGQGRFRDEYYDNETDMDVQDVRSPSALNVAYQKNMLWNGQFGATGVNVGTESFWTAGTPIATNHLGFEGVETQAIAGMGVHRQEVAGSSILTNQEYIQLFAQAFPNIEASERMTKQNAALAIAAYERTLLANQAPFQRWLKGETQAMSDKEKRGAVLFFGKAQCYQCHNGPALNSMNFYALGMNDLYQREGIFNAHANSGGNKGRGGFTQRPEDMFKFKVPQLYNLKESPFYGHGASFSSVLDVLIYKNQAIAQNQNVSPSQLAVEFRPLYLTETELDDLREFIEKALYDPNLQRYVPTSLPSGNCFPNNDPYSKMDLGCE